MKSFKEYISEKLEDIQGKVVDANELSQHLNKTQIGQKVRVWKKSHKSDE